MHDSITRRDFVTMTAMGAAALAMAGMAPAQQPTAAKRFKLIAFSKPFQSLSFDRTADLVAEVGWDGIECPVRGKGQVEPARVEEDLPKMVEAMGRRQLEVSIITTDVREVTPLNEKVLRTAAKLGIRKYRMGWLRYAKDKPMADQLRDMQAKFRDLAALNKELGIQGGYQNHSGADSIGAPVWDIHSVLKDLDPQHLGIHFDIGHATLEGGLCWPLHARVMQPHYAAIYVKDFLWEKGASGWRQRWCPLGEGLVKKSFFDELKKSAYTGPISQHHEYFSASTDEKAMLAAYKADLAVLRKWMDS